MSEMLAKPGVLRHATIKSCNENLYSPEMVAIKKKKKRNENLTNVKP